MLETHTVASTDYSKVCGRILSQVRCNSSAYGTRWRPFVRVYPCVLTTVLRMLVVWSRVLIKLGYLRSGPKAIGIRMKGQVWRLQ